MDRTNGANYILDANGHRIRRGKNVATGTAGTTIDPNYENDLQEELIGGFIEDLGEVPTTGAQRQLRQALYRLFGGNITVVSTTQALTADNSGLVIVNANAGDVTLTMPSAAAANGKIMRFKFVRTDTSAHVVNIAYAASEVSQPGGANNVLLGTAQVIELTGNGGAGSAAIWALDISASTQQKPYYKGTQTASISVAADTPYTVAGTTVVMPAFSSTGAFRVRGRMVAEGQTTGAGLNNFTSRLSDGTNTIFGATWLVQSTASGDSWGTSDVFESGVTYAPDESVAFLMIVGTASGSTNFTLSGCYFELWVEEA